MRYGEIIQRAVRITWRNKAMWIFGVLLAMFGGMGGMRGGPTGPQFSFGGTDMSHWFRGLPFRGMPGPMVDWGALAAAGLVVLGLLAIVGIFLAIVGIIVRYTSIGALIGMAAEEQAGLHPTFNDGLRRGWRRLLTLFLIALVIGIVGFLVGVVLVLVFIALGAVIALPAVAMFSAGGGWIAVGVIWSVVLGLGLIALAIVVAIIVAAAFTIVSEYAYRAAVLQHQGVFDAIGTALALLRTRFWRSAGIWGLLALIQLAIMLVLLPVALAIGGAIVAVMAALSAAARSGIPALVLGLPLLLVGLVVMLVAGGIYTVFESTAWTLFYLELQPAVEV
jgi:hypothetical protein